MLLLFVLTGLGLKAQVDVVFTEPSGSVRKTVNAGEVNKIFFEPVHNMFKSDCSLSQVRNQCINSSVGSMPDFYGSVVSSTSLPIGMYGIPTSSNSDFVKIPTENINQSVNAAEGGVRSGDYYYSIYAEELIPGYSLVYVDAWNVAESGWVHRWNKEGELNLIATDFAVDPTTESIYGSLSDGNGVYELCIVTFPKYKSKNITRTSIGMLSKPLYAMAAATDGTIYALQTDGRFVKIDKTTAQAVEIGISGLVLTGKGSAAIDPISNRFYCTATVSEGSSGLYEIDINSGKATLIYAFPGNEIVTGLYCEASQKAVAKPSAPTGLTANFPGGELTGTIAFTAPTTDVNGNELHGALNYTISCSGMSLATGQSEFGEYVEATVILPSEGEHIITVTVSNENGVSEAETLNVRVGKGLPKTPVITATWTGEKMLVSWETVTESADGGFIDPSEITYKVTRYPDSMVVVDGVKTTSVEDVFEIPDMFTVYYYEIEASYADKKSAVGRTENIGVGAYDVPYTQDFGVDFQSRNLISTFTLIDANNDGEGWIYNKFTEVMRCRTMGNVGSADDWLIMPAIHLEQGMVYELIVFMKDGGPTLKEQFEIKIGRSNTPEAMISTLVESQFIENEQLQEFKSYINPSETGDYYIGFHCTTPQAAYYLYVDNISVVAKADAGIPQAPGDFTVIPNEQGLHEAYISFNAPLLDVSGNKLGTLDRISIKRDGLEIHSIESPAPGVNYTYTDSNIEAGNHDWTVEAYNRCGTGDVATVSAFVGIRQPAHPEWAQAVETEKDGEVKMSWATVSTDINGKEVSADKITYSIARLNGNGEINEVIIEGLTDNEYTFQAVTSGEQAFINFAVFAVTEGGYSKGVIAPQIIVGTPYNLPYRESFENSGLSSTPFGIAAVKGNAFWSPVSDDRFADMKSHDTDNGYVVMAASAEGDCASLTSAKISLVDAVNPVFSFYVFNMLGDWGRDDNEVEVQVGVDGVFQTVDKRANYETGDADCWNLVVVSLDQYVGKVIQIRLVGTCHHATFIIIDELEIKPYAPYDLRAVGFAAPERLIANKTFEIRAEVENNGLKPADGAAIVLYANEYPYKRMSLPLIDFGKSHYVNFNCSINPSFGKEVSFKIKVDFNGDLNPNNDITDGQEFDIEQTLLPIPSNLKATQVEGGKIKMTWEAPDMSTAVAAPMLETFDEVIPWTNEIEGWDFYDLDQMGIIGFDRVTFPNIPSGSQQSFWVMDDQLECLNGTFAAYSGHQYLANMNVIEGTTDDWAVSPRLCGREQTISFMARSYNWMYPETFSLMYSTTGNTPDDFYLLKEFYQIPWDWINYYALLPEGTTYFAIRSNTPDGVMLFIDDVSFVSDGAAEDLNLLGYQFYRDGILVNDQPITECTFTIGGYNPLEHIYTVTALYEQGESGPANILAPSSIESISKTIFSVVAENGAICINGTQGQKVSIYTIDGVGIYSSVVESSLRVGVQTGIYIVKVGTEIHKVVVD